MNIGAQRVVKEPGFEGLTLIWLENWLVSTSLQLVRKGSTAPKLCFSVVKVSKASPGTF